MRRVLRGLQTRGMAGQAGELRKQDITRQRLCCEHLDRRTLNAKISVFEWLLVQQSVKPNF